ncbi:aldose 1-epimerase family protein [Salinarimonas sp.]|uniref:aldose 1-epimerase family protein n=1 Tax=Salinarimonas sp. TaxID=2766526 RepID=UPI00391C64C6
MNLALPEIVHLSSASLRAAIARRGAELVSLEYEGRPLLWHGDPTFWDRRAPLLFPVVGRSPGGNVAIDARSYVMPAHGFARDRMFDAQVFDDRSTRLVLDADEATRASYPFAFRLSIDVAVEETRIVFAASIANRGDRTMPFGFGYHPGFLWPVEPRERSCYVLRFEAQEDGAIRRADLETGLLLPSRAEAPLKGRTLALEDALFEPGSLQFDEVRSRSVWFGPEGEAGLRIDFPDSPQLGIWTKPGAPFLCIEPWQGMAAEANGSPELAARPGMRMLAPGEIATYRMTIAVGIRDPQA